ncbi:MAG: glycosyl hydrolase family 18 protein [Chloroflexales bacterium]|nr:glycosyl hydrolase family 18 protein [Chloroflexales bacterium]
MPRLRRLFLVLVYSTAILVAVALIVETLQMAQRRTTVSSFAATSATPSATAAPEVTPVALLTVPTPAPTTLAIDNDSETQPKSYHPKTGRYIAAWWPDTFGAADLEEMPYKDLLDEISPFWYSTDSSGRLYGVRDDELVRAAQRHNIRVIPTIHSVGDPSAVIALLSNPQRRAYHIQLIVDEVLARNYDGIDIDYEALGSSMREEFSIFIRDLADALHSQNKMLTVAVHAKVEDYGGLGGYQDWAEIGQYVDRLRIMTYDYSWRGSNPGPVAPLYWVQAVAEYATTVVDPAKVVIGIPFYGYDWPPSGRARALPWSDINDLIEERDLTVNMMERNRYGQVDESWFSYQSSVGMRQVWFMTDNGLESKLDLVVEKDLAGIAIWRIGYEKPEYWEIVRRKLVEDPALIQRAINPLLPDH